ncbi:uncharacterized serine-rich protein C215.13-like [Leptopilina heterotoma]|uniref:uncharacterized serine-rich protein C215.13-like n=1 Tax=Leptopilina heterotoma TaxID=63436 RepID=UPI001CA826FE|nr:uncharacterized serine-rich protein C215.13-like [Leptopilina heterotoma]
MFEMPSDTVLYLLDYILSKTTLSIVSIRLNMRLFIFVVSIAIIDFSTEEARADVRLYRGYRLNKDKRGAADYSTSYVQATPSQLQSQSSSSQANYVLSPGIQNYAALGGSHDPSAAVVSPISNFGHTYNLRAHSLSDQGNLILPTQTKAGPVTFGAQAASSASSSYPSAALHGGIQGMAMLSGQSGGYSIPLLLAASPGLSDVHLLPQTSAGSGESQSYGVPISGSQQPNIGSILLAASPISSSKYNIPMSASPQGGIIYAPYTSAYGTSKDALSADSGLSSTNYAQPIPSFEGSNSGSSSFSKYIPASSEGSAYVPKKSLISNYRSQNSAYNSPSASTSSNPTYNSYSHSFSSPSAYRQLNNKYSSPSSNYVSQVENYSSPSTQSQSSPSYTSGSYQSPGYSGNTKGGGLSVSYANLGSSYSSPSLPSSHSHPSSSQSSSGHSFSGTSYGSPSISYSNGNSNYLTQSASNLNPSVAYASADSGHSGTSGYPTSYASFPQGDLSGAYASLNTKYLRYPETKVAEKKQSTSSEYDTISYSSPVELS